MPAILKQLKYFWIYDFIVALLLAVKYILPKDSEGAFAQWTFLIYLPLVLLPFVAGPILGYFTTKKYHINILTSVKMSIIIYLTTFLTMCITNVEYFMRDGLFDAYYTIVSFPFHFPALVMALLFEAACFIKIHRQKVH